ncbi:DNA recombination protein RmuC [Neptuniibacter caesariensis]|uniref:DNA recombination protein RmuC n=1 Tax=Neptuniibacter caesariensis TaxID=207954 RepID=A0A7U8C5Z9_NEPCE|nr:DNA recombination protein RmuC [Neptuniibacter caesariensis]EAR61904.1 hypothetical protein MED92_03113 [Oceanospirillum sp. MED92] [Neptuniibacter caesariensis]
MTWDLSSLDLTSLLLGLAAGGFTILLLSYFTSRIQRQKWLDLEAAAAQEKANLLASEQAITLRLNEATEALQQLRSEQHHTELQRERLTERLRGIEPLLTTAVQEKKHLEKKLEQTAFQLADRSEVVAELETRLEAEREAHADKLKTLEQAREQLREEFQNVANRIFDEKSKQFRDSNQENLGQLLNPLKDQLGDFKRKVEDVYDKEAKDRRALHEQINHLRDLNQQMSEDAINLTKALKGDSKAQGNWGEVILERALEESGLRKGYEFELQVAVTEEGQRYLPDAVIHLPDGKDIIVDSKVSLTAYERYCAAEDPAEKARFLREHLLSVRGHIKGLSEKAYQGLSDIRSLDFVLLFIPIEGAFLLALEKEPALFKEAFDRNIMLVSPATLMVTLRTIHNIWRYEHQNQNAQEIAKRGGELHDKFVGFLESLDDIGRNLDRTQQAFDTAHKRLASGRGNLVSQVAMLQKLGAEGKKQISKELVDRAIESDKS